MNADPAGTQPDAALIAEVTKRAGVIWVEVAGRRPRAVWHVWIRGAAGPGSAGAAYLLTGPGEQDVPGLADVDRVEVTVPAREPGEVACHWTADVVRVEPAGAEWEAVIGPLLAGRLNEPLAAGETSAAERWARTCLVSRLQPATGH